MTLSKWNEKQKWVSHTAYVSRTLKLHVPFMYQWRLLCYVVFILFEDKKTSQMKVLTIILQTAIFSEPLSTENRTAYPHLVKCPPLKGPKKIIREHTLTHPYKGHVIEKGQCGCHLIVVTVYSSNNLLLFSLCYELKWSLFSSFLSGVLLSVSPVLYFLALRSHLDSHLSVFFVFCAAAFQIKRRK